MIKRKIFSTILTALLVVTVSQAQETPLMMWEASSDTNTVYLLGSIHLGSADFYPMAPEIEAAFEESSALVVEADISDPAVMASIQEQALQEGIYPEGESLFDTISADTATSLEAFCTELGIPCEETFATQRPWLASLTLGVLPLLLNGLDLESGVDTYFLNKARETDKDIVEIEDASWQLSLFTEESPETMEIYLREGAEYAVENPDYPAVWTELYTAGDAQALETELRASFENPEYSPETLALSEKILQDRNPGMADIVEENLLAGENVFVVVGIAHLLGEDSVVELLEERGYSVEQVSTGG